ncbi:hypothetical protein DS62_10090 [Smithella sp. SC_K08D17]|jgi:dTDP-4-amino-4,6-dideoxygalactose transaminase|nr:hypothetical protein DS62_10090 [Smithella sp. SC_K08D17]
MNFIDLASQQKRIRNEIEKNINKVLDHGNYLLPIAHNPLITPYLPSGARSAWAQYSLLAKDESHRTVLLKKLQENKIPTAIYYPKPLHLQTAFAYLGYKKGDFPVSEDSAICIFSLPMHPYLQKEDQRKIVETIKSAC